MKKLLTAAAIGAVFCTFCAGFRAGPPPPAVEAGKDLLASVTLPNAGRQTHRDDAGLEGRPTSTSNT